MIEHRLFVKGEQMYALLSSHSNPNILIPVKAIVKDVKYNEINPQYQIKILKFLDTVSFLKKYLVDCSFATRFDKRARKISIEMDEIKTKEDFEGHLNEKGFLFIVDSIMTKKYKGEIIDLFNKVQDYLVEVKLKELRTHMTRVKYTGKYKFTGEAEFNARLKKFIGDRITAAGYTFEDYFRLL